MSKDHEFVVHASGCEKCRSVQTSIPKTLINCCLVGAPLLRDYLVALRAPEVRKNNAALRRAFLADSSGKVHRTTKRKVQEVMRYKDDKAS